jgi:hypothetical protein
MLTLPESRAAEAMEGNSSRGHGDEGVVTAGKAALAQVLLFDQMTRNIYRGSPAYVAFLLGNDGRHFIFLLKYVARIESLCCCCC